MKNIFDLILDKDEKIVKNFKPKKSVFFAKNLIPLSLFLIIFEAVIIFASLGEVYLEESSWTMGNFWITLGVSLAVIVVIFLLTILFMSIYYRNVHYAYTNKRIVIRKGVFGVDYKSLDIDMIGASTVNVSLLDKLLRKNTGTISFGSMASPMVSSTSVMTSFVLAHLENPYDIYKEIKNYISDSSKSTTKKTAGKSTNSAN